MSGTNISLSANQNYKPFISEKELIQTIIVQEGEIINTMRLFWEVLPRNFRLYKDYGDRLMNNGERMRLQLNQPGQDCKDLFTLLFQLGQFFEIIGRLFSQNFNNVALEMAEPLNDAVVVIRKHKDQALNEKALKILPKAQQLHGLCDKQKAEYERATKEAQDLIAKMKLSRQGAYNLSEQTGLEEKASRAVKDMEERKARYQGTVGQFEAKNQQFIGSLERLTKEHQELIDYSATTVKRFMENCVSTELTHYENLNLITPEKAQVIKNFVIKQDLFSDIKIAEELSLKIDLAQAKQKVLELSEGQTTHQSVSPFCQYACDASDFYTKMADKWSKYLSSMMQFLQEMSTAERTMVKAYRDLGIADRKKSDAHFGAFQGAAFEFLRTMEQKERHHLAFSRYLESTVAKAEQIAKQHKADEKLFVGGIQRLAKEVAAQNEKLGKQTLAQEKQLVKISQMLSSNFQGQLTEKTGSFRQLMIEYQALTETLKESYGNFKAFVLQALEQEQEMVKSYKHQQISVIRSLSTLFQSLTGQEQTIVEQHQQVQKEFTSFVDVLDVQNLISQFKCQLINKHQVEFLDSESPEREESPGEIPPVDERTVTEMFGVHDDVPAFQLVEDPMLGNGVDSFGADEPPDDANKKTEEDPKTSTSDDAQPEVVVATEPERGPSQQMYQEEEKVPQHRSLRAQHESFVGLGEVKLDRLPKHVNRTALPDKTRSTHSLNQTSIISPLKKQLEKLSSHRDHFKIDEQTQREFDSVRLNMKDGLQNVSMDDIGGDGSMTPNSKFLADKFMGLMEDEKCLETFSCAISLKILIQGRLYVTNKRLCFHSYFNDKTIFGKETKIMIPLANVTRVEKKTNIMVFPNSISIFTKEEKEIFITSFVFRDQAHELIQRQIDIINGRTDSLYASVEKNRDEPREYKSDEVRRELNMDNPDELPFEQGAQFTQEAEDAPPKIEEQEEVKGEAGQIFDNSAITVTEEFIRVEQERLEKIKRAAPELEKYSFVGYDEVMNCSVKHIFQVFMNYNLKWPHLDNLSVLEWLDKYPLTNVDVVFDQPAGLSSVPDYFANTEVPAPEPETFKEWPLLCQFKNNLTHITEKPKFMQPKTNKCDQLVNTYFVSPRMIIRRALFQLDGIPFADSFNFEYKITYEQLDAPSPFKTRVKSEFRVNILKPIRFLQGTVVKETEASLRDTYAQGAYKEALFKKILEVRDLHRERWEARDQLPAKRTPATQSKSQPESRAATSPAIQNKEQADMFESVQSTPIFAQSPTVTQHQVVDNSKEIKELTQEVKAVKDQMRQLQLAVIVLLVIAVSQLVLTFIK